MVRYGHIGQPNEEEVVEGNVPQEQGKCQRSLDKTCWRRQLLGGFAEIWWMIEMGWCWRAGE